MNPTLFDAVPTRPYLATRTTDPEPSIEAARQLTGKVDRDCWMHLKVTGRHMTCDQIAAELGYYPPTVTSAVSRLVRDGFVVRSGDGLSARGNKCGTYRSAA